MASSGFEALPQAQRAAVEAALKAAFGAGAAEAVRPLAGGASGALTWRIEAGGRAYAMRLETARDFFRDTRRGFACLAAASEAGVAPPVRWLDAAAGISISDFVESRPLRDHPGGPEGLAKDLGRLVGALQASPPFPPLADYPLILDGMVRQIAGSGLFARGLLAPHLEGLARIRAAYPWDPAGLVSSHNDPNPRNVVFDGARLWLVDWELAFRNDPLVDVAILANEFARGPAFEAALLTAWLGRAPDRATQARFVLMRSLGWLFYAGLILSRFAAQPRAGPGDDLAAPTPEAFRAAAARGELAGGAETHYAWGKICLAAFHAALSTPEFEDALAVVGA